MKRGAGRRAWEMTLNQSSNLSLKLWLIVALEVISPIPAFLTIGAIIVLLAKPPWFRQMVDDLYRS